MRYIYYITIIIVLGTVAMAGWIGFCTEPPGDDVVLVVNDRTFNRQELAERQEYTPYHYRSEREFLDELITRELLIQEAP